jgi:hypothetical protein
MATLLHRAKERMGGFLFGDYQSLDERVRMLVYGLLLLLGYRVFFHGILSGLVHTPDELFWPSGIFHALSPVFDRDDYVSFISYTRHAFIFLWICATLGFLGRFPMMATGFFVFAYWGVYKSEAGTNHTYHVPMYALLIMGLVCRPGRYSLDALLSHAFTRYPFRPSPPSRWEGFALKCLVTLTAYVLFSAGISKVWNGGLQWLDGETLYQYMDRHNRPSGPLGERLLHFLLQHKPWIRLLSVWSVTLELSFILLIFLPASRLFLLLNGCAFHIGIYLLLPPKYLPQMTVYLLLVNWDRLLIPKPWSLPGFARLLFRLAKAAPTTCFPTRSLLPAAGFYMLLVSILAATIIIEKEPYPLTHVPMYSNAMTRDRIGGRTLEELRDIAVLKEMSREYLDRENPWYLKYHIPQQLVVEERLDGHWEAKSPQFLQTEVDPALWGHRITVSLMRDLERQPLSDHMEFPHADQVFQAVCRQKMMREGLKGGFRLVWRLEGGSRVLSVCTGVDH